MIGVLSFCVFAFTASFLGCFFLWPIWEIIQGGFFNVDGQFTLGFFDIIFHNRVYIDGLLNSTGLGLFSTLLSLLIAMPLAYFTDRYKFPLKKTLTSVILLPIMLPPFVGTIGIQQIFGTYGVLNSILLKFGVIEPGNYIDWLGSHKFLGIAVMNALSLYP
ncbi:MAG: hypothetical protein LBI37_00025, partial [Puniceicoccales bacterium]|nr:hypothetical protein [Puniceicoccales bacterium]